MKCLAFKVIVLLTSFFILDFLVSTILFIGLEKSFNLKRSPEILLNGSSMTGSGISEIKLKKYSGYEVSKYVREGVSVFDRYEMINHFFHIYPIGIKVVIYEVNPVLLSGEKTSENSYTHFYPFMDDDYMNAYIKDNAYAHEYYIHKFLRSTRFNSRLIADIAMDLVGISNNIKTNVLDTSTNAAVQSNIAEIKIESSNKEVFEKTMEKIFSHNSKVILVMMPMHYYKFSSFRVKDYENLCRYFENFCSTNKNAKFLDLNNDTLIYKSRYFSDPLHFNIFGQEAMSGILGAYIDTCKSLLN